MMTQAPVPDISILLKLLCRQPFPAQLAAPWHRKGEVAGWLSRSGWSLALIALWRRNRFPTNRPTVWIPDFFCNSSLAALRETGARLVFYPLTTDMAPDLSACQILTKAEAPDIFLLVHYFGRPAICPPLRDFCKRHNAWLVEDAAHVLRPVSGVGTSGDFVLYSPHKNLPLPDGAVLVVRPEGPAGFQEEALSSFGVPGSWPQQLSAVAQHMGSLVSGSRLRPSLWLAKRVLQKIGVKRVNEAVVPFEAAVAASKSTEARWNEPAQSSLSLRLLSGLISRLGNIAIVRQRHQLLWDAILLDRSNSPDTVSVAERPSGRAWTPYLSSYRTDIDSAKSIYEQWKRRGIPVTIWPDLPPEVMAHSEQHANALYMRHTRLYIPVHQSMRPRDIVSKSLPKPEPSQQSLKVSWGQASSGQWLQWIAQTGRSNLLQSWTYGLAKSEESGWRVSRGVFYRGIEPVAVVQVLHKRIAGALTVSRINRGPLLLSALSAGEMQDVWVELSKLGNLWRGSVLSIAPELALTGPNLALMSSFGFRRIFHGAWQSSWVNLRMDTAALRQQLDGKWRNALNFSEKAGLALAISNDDKSFEWMIERYQGLMHEKVFSGSPVGLLTALRKNFSGDTQFVILQALHGDNPVAGLCLVCHGSAATYLLGWNGDAGRNLKANQYLLWQATLYLKSEGLEWFDLGGVDEDRTPGIAAFKLGFGAERYELVGEYWKW